MQLTQCANNLLLAQLMAFFLNAFCVFHAAIQDAAALGSFDVDANVRVNFTKSFVVSTAFWKRSRVTEREGRLANRDGHDRRVRIPHAIRGELREQRVNANVPMTRTTNRATRQGPGACVSTAWCV
jgi:hypothetical protein